MASTRKTHPEVEYSVDDASGNERIFKTFDEAAGFALAVAASGRPSNVDVLVYGERGAAFVGGDDGVEAYRDDPDASVFERLEVSVNNVGRIP